MFTPCIDRFFPWGCCDPCTTMCFFKRTVEFGDTDSRVANMPISCTAVQSEYSVPYRQQRRPCGWFPEGAGIGASLRSTSRLSVLPCYIHSVSIMYRSSCTTTVPYSTVKVAETWISFILRHTVYERLAYSAYLRALHAVHTDYSNCIHIRAYTAQ